MPNRDRAVPEQVDEIDLMRALLAAQPRAKRAAGIARPRTSSVVRAALARAARVLGGLHATRAQRDPR